MNDQSWNGETNVIVNRRTAVFVLRKGKLSRFDNSQNVKMTFLSTRYAERSRRSAGTNESRHGGSGPWQCG
jgi:hypothetical protein